MSKYLDNDSLNLETYILHIYKMLYDEIYIIKYEFNFEKKVITIIFKANNYNENMLTTINISDYIKFKNTYIRKLKIEQLYG